MRCGRRSEPRPLRNRIHLDVVRPAAAVRQANLGQASGRYGVCHTDPDGNEVDLVPGGALGEGIGTADWQAVFSAIACYRVTSPSQQRDLATAAAALAADAGFPLLVDLRPGLVIIDSGKDQWEDDVHDLEVDFTELAGTVQSAAREPCHRRAPPTIDAHTSARTGQVARRRAPPPVASRGGVVIVAPRVGAGIPTADQTSRHTIEERRQ